MGKTTVFLLSFLSFSIHPSKMIFFFSLLVALPVVQVLGQGPGAQIPISPNTILTPGQPLSLDSIPLIGFGTWNLDRSNATEAVSWAIRTGYRHIDCAAAYKNQDLVGKGIADGLAKTGLKREDLWITSKLWNDQYGLLLNPPHQTSNILTLP